MDLASSVIERISADICTIIRCAFDDLSIELHPDLLFKYLPQRNARLEMLGSTNDAERATEGVLVSLEVTRRPTATSHLVRTLARAGHNRLPASGRALTS